MKGQWEPWLCAAQSLTSKNEQRTMLKSKPTMLSYDVQKSRSTAIQQNAGGLPLRQRQGNMPFEGYIHDPS